MMRSMYAGVSGLKVHQVKMDVVGNNIANVNTVGFKSSRVTFKEILSQTLQGAKAPQGDRGGMNPQQVGLGVGIGSIDTNHEQGNLQSTGLGTDLAIQGNGYFVVNNGNQNLYTRAGALKLDDNGNLVNATNGFIVQGWMSDANGNINTNNPLQGIKIPVGQSMPAQPTRKVIFGKNLDSRISNGVSRTATIDIFDSLGESHTISLDFIRRINGSTTINGNNFTVAQATPDEKLADLEIVISDNDGSYFLNYDPDNNRLIIQADWDNSAGGSAPASLTALETDINNKLAAAGFTGSISLDYGGTIADLSAGGTLTLTAENIWDWTVSNIDGGTLSSGGSGTIEFNGDGQIISGGNGSFTFNPDGGATPGQKIDIEFNNSSNPVTQLAADFTIDGIYKDGYEKGDLESFTIDDSGVITGGFSNGMTRALGQIAIANFSNPSGLTKIGDTLYTSSENSGIPQIGVAGNGGRGKIASGTLEMSNVDLAEQFTDMITTQRGFQANSKIITVADQMLQDLVNLKR
ncbi:MAG: flagellar hook protein FlgE [Halanaerobiales bacterium]|nr:flagellar hook protein FlgE [Halanaerobiales bacterium]